MHPLALDKVFKSPMGPSFSACLEKRAHVIDREYYDHAEFLFPHVLQPLSWIGFLEETSDGGRLTDRTYWKTPLWRAYLQLETDGMVDVPHRH